MKIKVEKKEKEVVQEVTVQEPLVRHLVEAERVAGTTSGVKFTSALLAQICTFDGKKKLMEEIMEMRLDFFTEIAKELPAVMASLEVEQNSPKPSSA